MSAIAGIFNRSGRPRSTDEIDAMLDVMAARGPDRRSTWNEGPVTLGHGLLIATPEATHEPQPFTDPLTRNTIVADIRLDNRAEIIRKLGFAGRRIERLGDAELALAAYGKWGTGCGSRLLGAFAFAIWDEQEQKLILIRDHFGVRPLVYFVSDDLFVFASDARAILSVDGVPRELNRDRAFDFLIPSIESVEVNATFFKSIQRLTPAHSMEVRTADPKIKPYWQLREPPILRLAGTSEYIEAHNAVFGEAVRCRLRGRDDAGVMLSGGIDSAAIAAFAADGGCNRAYSAVTTPGEPETRRISMAAGALGLDLKTVNESATDRFLGSFTELVRRVENPFALPMTLPAVVFHKAADEGRRSLLAGIFANEVTQVSLSNVFALQWHQGEYLAALLQLDPTGKLVRKLNPTALAALLAGALPSLFSKPMARWSDQRWSDLRAAVIDKAHFVLRPGERERLQHRLDRERRRQRRGDAPGSARTDLFARHYAAAGLERYDLTAAAQSLEVRSPYIDKRVVEFWLSLPAEQLVWRGWNKVLLRRSLENRLPRDIAWCKSNEHLGFQFTSAWLDFDPAAFLRSLPNQAPLSELLDLPALRSVNTPDEGLWQASLGVWVDSMFP